MRERPGLHVGDPLELAVISDIHGNRWALEAVLEDIERRGIADVANLGDCLYGPLDPAGTARLLMEAPMIAVRGNEDRILLDDLADVSISPSLRFTRENLSEEQLCWAGSLPTTVRLGSSFLLCHGTPAADDEYLLFAITVRGAQRRGTDELRALLGIANGPVVLCGHDHLPALAALGDGRIVIDPGSVGLPAYADPCGHPHTMETGSPHARYAVVGRSEHGWRVEHVCLEYDWRAAAQAAARNGRSDWAEWLSSGRARIG